MLTFSYDIQKDAENIIRASKSVNSPTLTEVEKTYVEKYGDVFEKDKVTEFVMQYLADYKIDTEAAVESISAKWRKIEHAFIKRADNIFHADYSKKDVHVFFTIDSRCTYNIPEGYFFARISGRESNRTIMHELFHFYTWDRFGGKKFGSKNVAGEEIDGKLYNDIKESLTELLNIEFSDLLDGAVDKGYPQHKEMRDEVRRLWNESKDIDFVVENLANK